MMKYVVIKQHYDMVPGTIIYKVDLGRNLFTVNKDNPSEPYLRIVPADKVEAVR